MNAVNKPENKTVLTVQKRDVLGKKVKKLRKNGLIPANVFGPDFNSISIMLPLKDFIHAYKIAHETGIVYLQLDKDTIPTLIKIVQHHPIDHSVLHVDFRKIDLKQKIETAVPVEVTGESIAVTQHGGVLLTQHDHLMVEALPQDIPQNISVDISTLKELGQEIKVSDLPKSSDYEIKDDPSTVIVSIIAHKEESVTPETTAVEPEIITEAEKTEEGEGAEAATPAPETPSKEAPPKEEK